MGKLTDRVAKGVFWVLLEKFGIQLSHFVVTLVLARLLTPDDYGTVALLSVFIALSNVFVDAGFGKALVQKTNATQVDYNTVFYLSMVIAAVLYAVLFFSAPFVARFYGVPDLKIMLRVLALSLIFHSINGVQNVELNRKMLFHLSFRISWVRTIVSAVTGISFALAGYGSWALVWASIFGGIAGVIARQLVIRWRPSLTFSWDSAKGLFRFGWKMTAAKLVAVGYSNLYAILIGKFFTRAELAFVKKGAHVPRLITNSVEGPLERVSFSAFSKLQNDPERLRDALRRVIRTASFFIFPLMAFCACSAYDLVYVLFGSKWLPTAPFVVLWSVTWSMVSFNAINMQAITACGRSDVFLKITVIRRLIGLATMCATLQFGVFVFVTAIMCVNAPLSILVYAWPNSRYLGYTPRMQLKDARASLGLTAVFCGVVYGLTFVPMPSIVRLLLQGGAGFGIYLFLAYVFRVRACSEMAVALLAARKRLPAFAVRSLERLVARNPAVSGGKEALSA